MNKQVHPDVLKCTSKYRLYKETVSYTGVSYTVRQARIFTLQKDQCPTQGCPTLSDHLLTAFYKGLNAKDKQDWCNIVHPREQEKILKFSRFLAAQLGNLTGFNRYIVSGNSPSFT